MTTSSWDPAQYDRFRDERRQPFFDLLALVDPRPGMRIVDLGCGTGELTRILHQRLAAADTLGLDASETMLARSAASAGDGVRFARADIADFADTAAWDLVFSNAALHWVPDHEALFARLAAALAPGGQIAVQVPANHDHPTHVVAVEVAAEPEFAAVLGTARPPSAILAPEAYAVLLARLGCAQQHVRLQVYLHRLAARDEVVEWVKGSLLTEYRQKLPAALYDRFLARYRDRLLSRLDDTRPYLYPFKRVLLWAER